MKDFKDYDPTRDRTFRVILALDVLVRDRIIPGAEAAAIVLQNFTKNEIADAIRGFEVLKTPTTVAN